MKKSIIQILSALILFMISLLVSFENIWMNHTLYIISYLIVGAEIVWKAIKNIFKGDVFDEHFLMAIATIGAFAIGEFPEAVAVMLFYQIGELFQDYAVDKSKKSIASLMDIRPDFANVKHGNEITKVNPNQVKIGDIIMVKPGEKIPIEPIGISKEELLKYAVHAESYSNHPISLSLKKVYNKEIDSNLISKTEELSGLGILACLEGKDVLIGNEKLMEKKHIAYTKCNEIGTILYVAVQGKYIGFIVIADKIKSDAKQAIQNLKAKNIKQTIMLTGDRKIVGESVAKDLGINQVYTDLLPSDKAEKLEEIIKEKSLKGKVAFVGDGINDAPVLALADVGVSVLAVLNALRALRVRK